MQELHCIYRKKKGIIEAEECLTRNQIDEEKICQEFKFKFFTQQ